MAAQVFSFRRREAPSIDWTRDELAELYRIEHALVQSGLSVEIERGISDEDDPWFVFCRSDGEVLIHLTRFDGFYRLYSPALPSPLIGRSFTDLTKSFSDQIPLHVIVQRGGGARLFVHPASMLAVVIGTILIASHDLVLSPQSGEADNKSADGSEQITGQNLKALLQSSFQSYFDSFLGWLREGATIQQSSYLNVISTVAAFIVGSATALNVEHGPDESSLGGHTDITDQTPAPDSVWLAALPTEASHDAARAHSASAPAIDPGAVEQRQDTDGDNGQSIAIKFVSVTPTGAIQHSDNSARNGTDGDKAAEHLLANADSLITSADQPVVSNLFSTDWTKLRVDLVTYSSNAPANVTVSAADPLHDLLTSLSSLGQSSGSNSEINALLAHAVRIDDGGQNLISFFLTSNQFVIAGQQGADSHPMTVSAPIPFDANAATILADFLQSNPHASAVFDNHSIVVYDAVSGSQAPQVTLHVWEFPDGSTIALVGHVDHGFVA